MNLQDTKQYSKFSFSSTNHVNANSSRELTADCSIDSAVNCLAHVSYTAYCLLDKNTLLHYSTSVFLSAITLYTTLVAGVGCYKMHLDAPRMFDRPGSLLVFLDLKNFELEGEKKALALISRLEGAAFGE